MGRHAAKHAAGRPGARCREIHPSGESTLVAILILIIGLGALLYPTVSNWLSDQHHATVISKYDASAVRKSRQEKEDMLSAARRYNESLVGDPVHDPFVPGSGYAIPVDYESVLNPDGDGVMGTIEIPKINVDLPIYHDTGVSSLERGVGHIPNTPLPIGGKGWHSVFTGHRGLPSAELFTRLDELGPGDVVLIKIFGTTHAYKVYGTEVVLPDQLGSLASIKGRDLLTLVTCTPYGVNTHRLLVHCERTAYNPKEASAQKGAWRLDGYEVARLAGIALGALIVVLLAISRFRRRREAAGKRSPARSRHFRNSDRFSR